MKAKRSHVLNVDESFFLKNITGAKKGSDINITGTTNKDSRSSE